MSELMLIGVSANLSIITEETKALEREYNTTCITVDGQDHSLAHFAKNGEPIIVSGVKQEEIVPYPYHVVSNSLQPLRFA